MIGSVWNFPGHNVGHNRRSPAFTEGGFSGENLRQRMRRLRWSKPVTTHLNYDHSEGKYVGFLVGGLSTYQEFWCTPPSSVPTFI